ncbi:Acetolactate synthase large subunit [Lentzea xinjiangensis]|uniref:Acetolactate synthase large subunit n=1 Tax=Lentzea xinjiangensis TaxID=402600 RepID=A0A1H9W588_9PSEU|nr:Acetolactate synthase large subunit [Lentzea xinjiangensis]
MTIPALTVTDVGHTYDAQPTLEDVSFTVAEGEMLCVVGPSGCGKTTLLRILAGLQPPTRGRVEVAGQPVTDLDRGIAVVLQDYHRSLPPWLRVADTVALPLLDTGLDKTERTQRVRDALTSVGLSDVDRKRPAQLSGGMQQRVALARALATRPAILLLDEPFASVDAQTRFELEDLLLRVRHQHAVTTVLVTHDLDEAAYLGDRVLTLSRGPATTVHSTLTVDLPAPRHQIRTRESAAFVALRAELAADLTATLAPAGASADPHESRSTPVPTVRDAVHDFLRAQDMTTVFGNPGSTELGFLAPWPIDFRYVLALEEGAATAMADGYAQITSGPVLVNLHSAAGIGNAMGAIITAHHNRTPLVVLAGQQARAMLPHDPFLANLDPTGLGGTYFKQACQPARAQDVPETLARAVQIATQPPCGPVLLSVPADDWAAPASPVGDRPRPAPCGPDPTAVRELVDVLGRSSRTAFVVGAAADQEGAVPALVTLVDRLGPDVWAAPLSHRCSFPENHPRFAGHLAASEGPLTAALTGYDAIVVLGAPAFTYHVPTQAQHALSRLFVVSDDPQILARTPADAIGIHTSLALGIDSLITATASWTPVPPPPQRTPTPAPPQSETITAAQVLATLAELLPADAVVVEEIPSHRTELHRHLPITHTDAGFLTTGGGVLGYSVPAAVGAALAAPTRRIVALVGDGSLMYRPQALWTAAQQHTPITIIVLDNSGYGALHAMAADAGAHGVPGLDINGLDFVGLAQSMGCHAFSVTAPAALRDALTDALHATAPTLVHIYVEPSHQPLRNPPPRPASPAQPGAARGGETSC